MFELYSIFLVANLFIVFDDTARISFALFNCKCLRALFFFVHCLLDSITSLESLYREDNCACAAILRLERDQQNGCFQLQFGKCRKKADKVSYFS